MKKLLTIAFILVSLFSFGQTIDLGKYTTFGTITADYGVFDSIDVGVAVIDTTRALQTIQVDTVEEYTSGNGVYFKDATRFGNNMTVDGYIYQNDPGTTANSFLFLQSADSGGTVQSSSIQTMFGADPYIQIKAPNNVGLATTALNLYDDKADFFDDVKTDTLAEHTVGAGIHVKDALFLEDTVAIASGQKLFLDGGGDTYWYESGSNIARLYVGNTNMMTITTASIQTNTLQPRSNSVYDIGTTVSNYSNLYLSSSIYNGTIQMIDLSANTKVNVKTNLMEQDSLTMRRESSAILNDGAITLATGIAGWGSVYAVLTSSGAVIEWANFFFSEDGSVTLQTNSANVTTTGGTAASLNIYDAGTGVVIENKLGATHTLKLDIKYSSN